MRLINHTGVNLLIEVSCSNFSNSICLHVVMLAIFDGSCYYNYFFHFKQCWWLLLVYDCCII